MNIDLSNGLAGLALLGGGNVGGFAAAAKIETRAVRLAKAQFTLPSVTPPWLEKRPGEPQSAAVSIIRRMATIIDKPRSGTSLPADVQAAFTAYKALDRLKTLADWSARATTSSAERTAVQASFGKGLADLQAYLAGAVGDALTLSFAAPSRRVEGVTLAPATALEVAGKAVTSDRFAALAGLAGTERFQLKLTRAGTSDTLTINLATVPQPPTLDGVAGALNDAIAAIPMTNPDGFPVLDAGGQAIRRWGTSFSVVKSAGGWGLQLNTTGIEEVALRQEGAGDTLMVAAGQSLAGEPAATGMMRFDLAGGELTRTTLATFGAVDGAATAAARLAPAPAPTGEEPAPLPTIAAAVRSSAMVAGADGFSYVVGTTAGDVGGNLGDGRDDLLLTKHDAAGAVVWQRTLGTSGSAAGSAISIAANGDVIVAGTAEGDVDGAASDGDMLVARYSPAGDERFLALVRSAGADAANAVTETPDGGIIVGGSGAEGGLLARLDAGGRLLERRLLGGTGTSIRALQSGQDSSLVALTSEGGSAVLRRIDAGALSVDQAALDLGAMDARSLAIAADGRIAIGGPRGGDGVVAMVDAAMTSVRETLIASAGSDRLDSITWVGDDLYAGGRTDGVLGSARLGAVDGFVARIDAASGTITGVQQWGREGAQVGPVRVAAGRGLDTDIPALGFQPGVLNPVDSSKLDAQTSLRAGDRFSLRVDGGSAREFVIGAEDTLASLVARVSSAFGRSMGASVAKADGGVALRLEAMPGHSLQLIAGPAGRDALAKLGLAPSRITAAAPTSAKAPRVSPGGNYSLELSTALTIGDAQSAKLALGRITDAIGTTQSAFRSLYWDENKEAIVNGGASGRASPYLARQLARYQDALSRLGGGSFFPGY